jgi:hypothetical protein
VTAIDGTVVWEGPVSFGDVVWVVPGTYRVEAQSSGPGTLLLSMVVQTLPGAITEVSVNAID